MERKHDAALFDGLMKLTFYFSVFTAKDTQLSRSPTIWFHYLFVIPLLVWLIYFYRTIPRFLLVISVLFFTIGLFHVVTGSNTLAQLIKVITSLFFLLLFYYYYIKHYKYDTSGAFQFYMDCAVFTVYVFMIQLISYKIGFTPGYDFEFLGIPAFVLDKDVGFIPLVTFMEPAHLAFALTPAVFVAIHNLMMNKKVFIGRLSSVLIVLTIIISSSSTGFISLLIACLVIAISYRALTILIVSSCLGVAGFFLLYAFSPKFIDRFDDTTDVFVMDGVTDDNLNNFNMSTMVLYNHYLIATENFSHHPVTGTGLGSHAIAYDRYNQFDIVKFEWAFLNRDDACSLLLRMMSETGILGIALLLYFIFTRGVGKTASVNEENWIISKSIFVLIIPTLLRNGNYLLIGLPFFLLLYYYTYKNNRSQAYIVQQT